MVGTTETVTSISKDTKEAGKTHGHHSFPKYLGGHPKQKLSEIVDWSHYELHSDLRKFEGGWLNPKTGNTGTQIIEKYGQDKVIEGLKRFYSQEKYKHLFNDFMDAVNFKNDN